MSSQKPDYDQLARFREAARAVEADDSPDALDRVFGKLDVRRKPDADDGAKADPKRDDAD